MPLLLSVSLIISIAQSFHYFERPKSYNHICNVMEYGAKGDGKTNDSSAIQAAINSCYSNGSSSQVLLPSHKTFLIGPLSLTIKCKQCAFTISSNTTLLISNDRSKWPNNTDVITVKNMDKFVFEGPGSIHGQGHIWWENKNDFRPKIIHASGTNVVVTNIFIQNCPNHCLEMYTDSTEIFDIHIENPPSIDKKDPDLESHNTDGIDVHGSPFYVHDSIINTGDDNVAIHANDTLITNCQFGGGHGASIGSLGGGSYLTNITVSNIVFTGTTQGARIKVHYDANGGHLFGVIYRNLTMTNVGQAIVVTEYYGETKNDSDCKFVVEDILFEDITAFVNSTKDVGSIMCQPSVPCKNITLTDVKLKGSKQAWECSEATVIATDVEPKISCIS